MTKWNRDKRDWINGRQEGGERDKRERETEGLVRDKMEWDRRGWTSGR